MNRTLDRSMNRVAETQHSLVTFEQALAAGATRSAIRHRVRTGRWRELQWRVYAVSGAVRTKRQRLLAAVLAAGSGVASHRPAAALHEIPGFREGHPELSVARKTARAVAKATVHETLCLPPAHCRTVDSIPVTTVARTLFDLAGLVRPRRAERALDHCLACRKVTVPAMWRVLDDLAEHGRAGTVLTRELLLARGDGYAAPASELEARLLRVVADAGLPAPEREVDPGDTDGWVGRVELVFRDERVLVEADSRLHHSSLLDQEADRARDNRFMAAGFRVLRFTWYDVTERPEHVCSTIRAALRLAA